MKKLMFLMMVLCIGGLAQAALIAHYDMEETAGPLTDLAGGQTAVEVGAGHTYGVAGPAGWGSAAGMADQGSWQLNTTDAAELNALTNNFTVAAWINLDSTLAASKTGTNANANRIIGDDVAWDGDSWSFGLKEGKLIFTKNGVADVKATVVVSTDQWVHVAAVVSSTAGVEFYMDGVWSETVANMANGVVGDDVFCIGRSNGDGESQWFAGSLDEIRVYNTTLDATEIAQLASLTSKGANTPDPSNGEPDVEVDLTGTGRIVPGAVSWLAPTDPNVVQTFSYSVYIDPNEQKVLDATAATPGVLYSSIDQGGTSFDPGADLSYDTPYYWRVDAIVDFDYVSGTGISDANTVTGNVWGFTTKMLDAPPVVDAGDSIITTTALAATPFVLEGSVTNDETSPTTIGWEAFDVAWGGGLTTKVTFTDATDPNTTVTISETGTYILQLTATDATGSVSDQKEIAVYDDACEAAKATGEWTANYYDRDDDCDVDLEDFAVLALAWLDSTALSESFLYAATIPPVSENILLSEYWAGIGGGDPNDLLEDEDYPDSPDGAYFVTDELRGTLTGDDYGQRIRGYIVPPTTGSYIFYIASDDRSRLFLSADTTPVDTDPALGNQIAEVTAYTSVDTWDTEPGQTSASVSLTADTYYYIEVLHKEGGGGDHVSVAWSTDGGTTIDVIPGSALRYALLP